MGKTATLIAITGTITICSCLFLSLAAPATTATQTGHLFVSYVQSTGYPPSPFPTHRRSLITLALDFRLRPGTNGPEAGPPEHSLQIDEHNGIHIRQASPLSL